MDENERDLKLSSVESEVIRLRADLADAKARNDKFQDRNDKLQERGEKLQERVTSLENTKNIILGIFAVFGIAGGIGAFWLNGLQDKIKPLQAQVQNLPAELEKQRNAYIEKTKQDMQNSQTELLGDFKKKLAAGNDGRLAEVQGNLQKVQTRLDFVYSSAISAGGKTLRRSQATSDQKQLLTSLETWMYSVAAH
jgi:chromosome segregation ATPase